MFSLQVAATKKSVALAALLTIAIAFGGGYASNGVMNLVIDLAALGILLFNPGAVLGFFRCAPRPIAVMVCLTIALPLLQLVPLPPMLWQALPGRNLVEQSFTFLGMPGRWWPISVNPGRTLLALLSLIAPFTILVLTAELKNMQVLPMLWVIIAAGVSQIALGAMQLASGNQAFLLYQQLHPFTYLLGTFRNHNHVGIFLDCSLVCLAALPSDRKRFSARTGMYAGLGIVLSLGVVLTQSRSAIVLLVVPVAVLARRWWPALRQPRTTGVQGGLLAMAVLAAAIVGGTVISGSERVHESLSRFDDLTDRRSSIWQNSMLSIDRFWPIGSGIGTFNDVYQVDESLESLAPGRAVRAHNEYIEALVESGMFGAFLALAWLMALAWRAGQIIMKNGQTGGSQVSPCAIFLLFTIQSILDFPMREQALVCTAAFALGLSCRSLPRQSDRGMPEGGGLIEKRLRRRISRTRAVRV